MLQRDDPSAKRLKNFLEKANAALKSGEFDFARQYVQHALKMEPDNVEAKALLERIPIERARRWNFLSRLLQGAMVLLKVTFRSFESSAGVAEALAKSRPNKTFWFRVFGYCSLKLARWDDAIEAYETVVKHKSEDVRALTQLGELYVMTGRCEQAESTYARLVLLRPGDQKLVRDHKNATAQLYSKTGVPERLTDKRAIEEKGKIDQENERESKRQETLVKLRETCENDPQDARSRARLGRMLAEEEQFLEASKFLSEAASLNPKDIKILRQLAECQERSHHCQDALTTWQLLLKQDPEDTQAREEVLKLRARIMEGQLEKEPANAELRQEYEAVRQQALDSEITRLEGELRANPQDVNLTLRLGTLYRSKGRSDDAIHIYQALAKSPTRAFLGFQLLGEVFTEKQMYSMAIEQYEKALERAPAQSADSMRPEIKEIHYALGSLYELEGNIEKAIAAFKPVYEQDINFKDIRERFESVYRQK